MHDNSQLLNMFYAAFEALDAETMMECYAPDASFEDEVFKLQGRDEIADMWRMLCDAVRSKGRDDWSLAFGEVETDASRGRAHWEPRYRFSATGRKVHNIIEAEFEFRDGLIVRHRDRFNLWRWSRQALGLPGWLLGWTPMLREKVRAQAAANLLAYRQRKA
jgi:ketosteroid isomerase-like protein